VTWQVDLKYEAGRVVVGVVGDIDMDTEADLRAAVTSALEHNPLPEEIVVDLSGVGFLDSAGIRGILVGRRAAAERGIALRVENPQPSVRRVLQITQVDQMLGLDPQGEGEAGRPRQWR
jgi:anti-sigma B factor antagonist